MFPLRPGAALANGFHAPHALSLSHTHTYTVLLSLSLSRTQTHTHTLFHILFLFHTHYLLFSLLAQVLLPRTVRVVFTFLQLKFANVSHIRQTGPDSGRGF